MVFRQYRDRGVESLCQIVDEPMWHSNFHVSKIGARSGGWFKHGKTEKT